MATNLDAAVQSYLKARNLSRGTRDEYGSTLRKWTKWGQGVPIENIGRKEVREFLDWVHELAVNDEGTNPGRTANKAREHLRAVLSWAWEQELIVSLPRFPKPRLQRDVAGRHYLTKAELSSLYFATHQMRRVRGWAQPFSVGKYWRSALVVFFNYGVDTDTIWKSTQFHEPILWRHIAWQRECPDGRGKAKSRWGWISYRRVKTGKTFSGLVREEGEQLRVFEADKETVLPKSKIDERTVIRVSSMPEGQEQQWSREEFVDLIAYLQSLK